MVLRELKKEDGFTLAELLMALTIVSIVLAIVSSVFLFVNRQMNAWDSNMSFYNNYEVVQNKMYNDLLAAESIMISDTSLAINDLKGTKIYSWNGKVIRLNDAELAISEVDSLSLKLNNDPLKQEMYQWSIRQKNATKIFEQDFVLHLRKPILWEPIRSINSGGN
ncbi:MAG: prepilin-type N-terminal cleavage/methylation domain-containing protein [Balneolaceae bacterium]|nr:prepilin-type N-terminal cleavage/methylation domain-containing protein [Balneolaceae bacterium]MBO6546188.1 prepilin-type N-terminal cleavage/methylation domain-containing protein [Balneolaceae bacterium]MBO6648547.1 prepilin-type N-terminal cleavage/methylation domain-containing protein [Balneolaceae bacterium]